MALTSLEMAELAAEAALSRRARDVLILDLRQLASFTDFFVIGSGTSDTHLEGITRAILERFDEVGVAPWRQEGTRSANWMVLDYVDVVVHLFLQEARRYYNLERLWAEAPEIPLPDTPEPTLTERDAAEIFDETWDDLDEWDDLPLDTSSPAAPEEG